MSTPKKQPDPIDVLVGKRLKLRRILIGMTQGELAGKLGITFQQIHKYESGSNRIGASRLQAIAHLFNVPIGFFFKPEPLDAKTSLKDLRNVKIDATQKYLSSPEGVRLNNEFVKIKDPAIRSSVISLVQSLAANVDK